MLESKQQTLHRPATFKEVADQSDSLESFGYNLRDWQHEISRRATSHQQLSKSIQEPPTILANRFTDGNIADAYLAAYAEWLSLKAKVSQPAWSKRKARSLKTPWYSTQNRNQLEERTPESFSKRGVFTVPQNVFTPKAGRPRVSAETKRQKAIARQRAYRQRVKALLEKARASGLN
ncbi:hypothetical protein [Pelagicoccus sp. SDUM812002]|uniref:hypothetical protein n=1 Tax=Pelagicoccus sp. SDUM812002 TaxID=3041266 RepID=UPI00280FFE16|nr:hypothetical protein [Pelagicoccus sp. SDUM812002]MDQ8186952.1 hypothetical protein [Pelagicoccus sp. SDUM812002]